MLAIDTNVLVRYLTGDHPEQSQLARDAVGSQDVFVPVTVILECEWVLRSAYGFSARETVRALRAFAGLPTVTLESAQMVATAFDRAEGGMDFADALHLGSAGHCSGLITFDRNFGQTAKSLGVRTI